jgi:hypothetical protein
MIAPHFPDYRHVPISTQNTDDIRTYVEREVSMRYESVGFSKDQAVRLKMALIRMAEGM